MMKDCSVYILKFDKFSTCFNPFKRTLSVFDSDVAMIEQDLTTPESVMLRLICDEHIKGNLIVPRNAIERAVWNDAEELDRSSNLNQLTSTLRKKLKSIFHKDTLITHPRKGYSLSYNINVLFVNKEAHESSKVTPPQLDEKPDSKIDVKPSAENKSDWSFFTGYNNLVLILLWIMVIINITIMAPHIDNLISSKKEIEHLKTDNKNIFFMKEQNGIYYLVCQSNKGKLLNNLMVLSDIKKEKVELLCTK